MANLLWKITRPSNVSIYGVCKRPILHNRWLRWGPAKECNFISVEHFPRMTSLLSSGTRQAFCTYWNCKQHSCKTASSCWSNTPPPPFYSIASYQPHPKWRHLHTPKSSTILRTIGPELRYSRSGCSTHLFLYLAGTSGTKDMSTVLWDASIMLICIRH